MNNPNSKHNEDLEKHLDYQTGQRKYLSWKKAIILLCISILLIFPGRLEILHSWLRLFLLLAGSLGVLSFVFFVSTTKLGKGGWSGPSWWVP